jgi:predicted transcriptional regulator
VLQLQGNISDAEHLIRDSLRILEEGGVGHSQTALRRMSRLAEILVHSGQLQEAEILQRKILHILELLQVSVFSIF